METQPFVSIAPWTLIFQIANLLLLMVLFKKYLFKPVTTILEKRQNEIETLYSKAESAESEAMALKADYEKHMRGAREEAEGIIKNATESASRLSDSMIQDTKKRVEQLKRKAAEDIELEKQKAFREAKDEISGIALDIASQVLDREINSKDHSEFIESFIQNVGEP